MAITSMLRQALKYGLGSQAAEQEIETILNLGQGLTAGTAVASKFLLLDSSKGISTITSATITTLTSSTIAGGPAFSAGFGSGGGFTSSARLCHTGGVPVTVSTQGTNNTDNTAGTVYFAEIFVPNNKSVTGVAVFNGTAVAGNGKVMLYDSTGARVAISASTAMSGTVAYQRIAFTGAPIAVVGPATYFIGVTYDTTTHDHRAHATGNFATGTLASTTYGTDSTLTPIVPTTTFTADVGPIASLY